MKNISFKKLGLTALTAAVIFSSTSSLAGDTSITIYSKATPGSVPAEIYRPTPQSSGWIHYNRIPGYAVVRETREMNLDNRRTSVKFSDVAAYIDPTTVSFKSLTDPKGTSVLEQNFMFDLVSINKLAERYLGKEISFEKNMGGSAANQIFSGTVLSAMNGQLVVQKNDGGIVSVHANQAIFPKLPGELYTKPTLAWDIITQKTGKHEVEVGYQTGGITWWADYNATYSEGDNANEGYLDLSAWVSIVNKTGATYKNAKLKLIAGDVNRVQPQNHGGMYKRNIMKSGMLAESMEDSVAGFTQKSFFEFHMYSLGRKTTIADNSTKQVELFPKATKIPVKKIYSYYGTNQNLHYYGGINYNRDHGVRNGNKKVDVYLKFKNSEAKGLGIPLPSGLIRVSKKDSADGSLEFIGEDVIDHTPKNEKVLLKLGSAFDIIGERKQTDFVVDHARKYMDETFEITIRNHKDESVDVLVTENLYRGANWKIFNNSTSYKKKNSNLIEFSVTVPKNGERVISYTTRYSWK